MPSKSKTSSEATRVQHWSLSAATTLGSSVRANGILLELRARLPWAARKLLDLEAGELVLAVAESDKDTFRLVSDTVSNGLEGIESLPVIPREIEDILAISTTERHRWLKDGRLPSAGTRTVKLRGRARQITFHVFDPREVEDILNSDFVSAWREADVETAAENRRRAAWKAKLTRSRKAADEASPAPDSSPDLAPRPQLLGWEEFERDGPLR